jgi:hypothetical protein
MGQVDRGAPIQPGGNGRVNVPHPAGVESRRCKHNDLGTARPGAFQAEQGFRRPGQLRQAPLGPETQARHDGFGFAGRNNGGAAEPIRRAKRPEETEKAVPAYGASRVANEAKQAKTRNWPRPGKGLNELILLPPVIQAGEVKADEFPPAQLKGRDVP